MSGGTIVSPTPGYLKAMAAPDPGALWTPPGVQFLPKGSTPPTLCRELLAENPDLCREVPDHDCCGGEPSGWGPPGDSWGWLDDAAKAAWGWLDDAAKAAWDWAVDCFLRKLVFDLDETLLGLKAARADLLSAVEALRVLGFDALSGIGEIVGGIGDIVSLNIPKGTSRIFKGLFNLGPTLKIDMALNVLISGIGKLQTAVCLEPPGRPLDDDEFSYLARIYSGSRSYPSPTNDWLKEVRIKVTV